MWIVRQADDLFVCFGAELKGLELKISDETGSGRGKEGLREARGTELANGDAERQSTTVSSEGRQSR